MSNVMILRIPRLVLLCAAVCLIAGEASAQNNGGGGVRFTLHLNFHNRIGLQIVSPGWMTLLPHSAGNNKRVTLIVYCRQMCRSGFSRFSANRSDG